jgi:hypothetical protein
MEGGTYYCPLLELLSVSIRHRVPLPSMYISSPRRTLILYLLHVHVPKCTLHVLLLLSCLFLCSLCAISCIHVLHSIFMPACLLCTTCIVCHCILLPSRCNTQYQAVNQGTSHSSVCPKQRPFSSACVINYCCNLVPFVRECAPLYAPSSNVQALMFKPGIT